MDSLTRASYKVMIDEEEGMSTKLRQLVMAGLIENKKDLPYFKSALKKIKGGAITTVMERQILIGVLQQFLGMVDEAPEFFNLLRRQLAKGKGKKKEEVKKEELELAFEQVKKRRADKRNSEMKPHHQGSCEESTPGQVNEFHVPQSDQERARDAWYKGDDHYADHKKANPSVHKKVPVKKKGMDIPKGHVPKDSAERNRDKFYAKKEERIPDNVGHSTKIKKKASSPTTVAVKNPDYREDYGFTSFKQWREQKTA